MRARIPIYAHDRPTSSGKARPWACIQTKFTIQPVTKTNAPTAAQCPRRRRKIEAIAPTTQPVLKTAPSTAKTKSTPSPAKVAKKAPSANANETPPKNTSPKESTPRIDRERGTTSRG